MAAWAASAIRNAHPDAMICWAAESRCVPVIDQSVLANRVYTIPREKWKRRRWSPITWRDQILTYTGLRKFQFDWGIDLQGHTKTALLLRLAAPARRLAARATDEFAARMNPVKRPEPTATHTVEWNHQVISEFVCAELPSRPIMPPSPPRDSRMVTISVGASHSAKIYPTERWRIVASALVKMGFKVHVLGGPQDRPLNVEGTSDEVGRLALDVSMQRVAVSRLHVAVDTGTGHMAAAYGTPVLSLFGPTDPVEFRPYTDSGRVLVDPAMDFAPEYVIEAAREMLEQP